MFVHSPCTRGVYVLIEDSAATLPQDVVAFSQTACKRALYETSLARDKPSLCKYNNPFVDAGFPSEERLRFPAKVWLTLGLTTQVEVSKLLSCSTQSDARSIRAR
uniref:Uncharacterized protein n=1 Tax=Palpitomonas bilix TaxID=652834 RepID=A0A7S3D7U6_9EUKA|mmetsp:Transcript_26057/g.66171  ORF Transcript_26057/g.66171 Transcript_26057/m.66171 type:complete len:105 (+) Transcript_26057:279-593(+)